MIISAGIFLPAKAADQANLRQPIPIFTPADEMPELRLGLVWETPSIPEGIKQIYLLGDDAVYVYSNEDKIYAFEAKTGVTRWMQEITGGIKHDPGISEDRLYFLTSDFLYSMGRVEGNVKWKMRLSFVPTIAPAADDFTVFIAAVDDKTYAKTAAKGKPLWMKRTNGTVITPPIFYQRNVLFGAIDKKIYSVNANSGEVQWEFDTLKPPSVPFYLDRESELLYVACPDNNLYLLQAITGEKIAVWNNNEPLNMAPVLGTDNAIYQTDEAGNLFSLYINKEYAKGEKQVGQKQRQEVWRWSIGEKWRISGIQHILALGKNRIYVMTTTDKPGTNKILSLDIETGRVAWERLADPKTQIVANPRSNGFFIINEGRLLSIHELTRLQ